MLHPPLKELLACIDPNVVSPFDKVFCRVRKQLFCFFLATIVSPLKTAGKSAGQP
jgi:hypothetical protein